MNVDRRPTFTIIDCRHRDRNRLRRSVLSHARRRRSPASLAAHMWDETCGVAKRDGVYHLVQPSNRPPATRWKRPPPRAGRAPLRPDRGRPARRRPRHPHPRPRPGRTRPRRGPHDRGAARLRTTRPREAGRVAQPPGHADRPATQRPSTHDTAGRGGVTGHWIAAGQGTRPVRVHHRAVPAPARPVGRSRRHHERATGTAVSP